MWFAIASIGLAAAAFVAGYSARSGKNTERRESLPSPDPLIGKGDEVVLGEHPKPAAAAAFRHRRSFSVGEALTPMRNLVRSFSERDSESASQKSRGRQRLEMWWSINWRWFVPLALALLASGYYVAHSTGRELRTAIDAAATAALREQQQLEDLLRDTARRITAEEFLSGFVADGSSLSNIELDTLRAGSEQRVACVTAKHARKPYDLIALAEGEAAPILMWNSRSQPVNNGKSSVKPEASHFFPKLPAVRVEREDEAFVEYAEGGSGQRRRIRVTGDTLRCILHAQEVLSGAHMTTLVEAQRQLALKKMHDG